jgi:putative transposase
MRVSRITQSYNRRHGRKGTLWEERFKSLLVGGSEGALSAVAAYIDLNAVRAGIVADPKDYRFCGYGEAMGGSAVARRGLGKVMLSLDQTGDWRETVAAYRKLLYVTGEAQGCRTRHGVARSAKTETGQPAKPGFRPEQVEEVLKTHGALPVNELLRCRVRYFTDGAVLGSRAYVEDAFRRHRRHFSPKRLSGARKMLGGGWGDLYTMRRLRLNVIVPPMLTT